MPQNIDEFYEQYKQEKHERWDKTYISVMVFGPDTSKNTLGSQLRNYIINKCNDYGVTVRCEHERFIKIHRGILGPNRNLVFAEIDAARHVNAIIIIPDSPGSFIELGMLSPFKDIHQNVIILFKDKYESDDDSFVFMGPKLVYTENNAEIVHVNYRRKQIAWEKVKAFLHEKRADKYERNIVGIG